MGHREQLYVASKVFVQLGEVQQAAIAVDRQENQVRADTLGEQLPWHDIAVVLHLREQDFVAAFDVL